MTDAWIAQRCRVCRHNNHTYLAPGEKTCKKMDSRQLELLEFLNQASTNVRPQVACLRSEAGFTLALTDKLLKELVRHVGMWYPSLPACTD